MNRTNSRFTILAITLCTCILSAVLVACNGNAAQDQAAPTEAPVEYSKDVRDPDKEQQPAAEKPGKLGVTDLQAKKARSFVTVYVGTHVRNSGEEGEPIEMTEEDWVNNCLSYVDPESDLAKQFKEDPTSLRSPYGTRNKRVVNATKATASGEKNAVLITARIESTTSDWSNTSSYRESYLVRFGDSNLVTAIEPRGLEPAQ